MPSNASIPTPYEREELVDMIRRYGLVGVLDGIVVACNLLHLQHLGDEDQRECGLWERREALAMDAAELGRLIASEQGIRL